MKIVKPLLVAATLVVLSSASLARPVIGCRDSTANVNGINVVLKTTCYVYANGKSCGYKPQYTFASEIKTVTLIGGVCKIY